MGINELKAKLEAIVSKDAVADALNAAGSNEEILKILKDNGLEVSAEDMEAVVKALQGGEAAGELSADALENVAGGIGLGTTIGMIKIGKWIYDIQPIRSERVGR